MNDYIQPGNDDDDDDREAMDEEFEGFDDEYDEDAEFDDDCYDTYDPTYEELVTDDGVDVASRVDRLDGDDTDKLKQLLKEAGVLPVPPFHEGDTTPVGGVDYPADKVEEMFEKVIEEYKPFGKDGVDPYPNGFDPDAENPG